MSALAHVPLIFRSWTPAEQFVAQQKYAGVTDRAMMRYRLSQPIVPNMRVCYGAKVYTIRGVENYDQSNSVVWLFLEELQSTGSNH